jgi:hypothetical protein
VSVVVVSRLTAAEVHGDEWRSASAGEPRSRLAGGLEGWPARKYEGDDGGWLCRSSPELEDGFQVVVGAEGQKR